MKKFLVPLFSGLFVFSLLVAPVAALAVDPVNFGDVDSCRIRATLKSGEVRDIAGAATHIPGGTLLPAEEIPEVLSTYLPAINANSFILCVYSLVKTATNLIFLVLGFIAIAILTLSAIMYLTSAGNPDKTKKAKDFLLYAIIGIVIAVVARLIPAIIVGFFG